MIKRLIMVHLLLLLCSFSVAAAEVDDFLTLVKKCEGCHGPDGQSPDQDVPIIAGFSYEGFLNTMDVFREYERIAMEFHKPGEPETMMNEIARGLSEQQIDELARYFSAIEFKAASQTADRAQAERGAIIHKRYCEKCHSQNGRFAEDDAAILAGQWSAYLKRQFDNILTGKRLVPRTMLRRVKKLTQQDRDDLLHFYALQGQQP